MNQHVLTPGSATVVARLGKAPGLAARIIAGLSWAGDVGRGLRAAAVAGRLVDDDAVRCITRQADARYGNSR